MDPANSVSRLGVIPIGRHLRRLLAVVTVAVTLPVVAGGTAAAAACSGALTVTRISGGELDIDTGISPQLVGSYAGYRIDNTGAAIDDLWVKAGNFSGGVVSLAPKEDGLVHPGPLATSATTFAYIYLTASGAGTAQTHDVELYDGHPSFGGTQLCSESYSLQVVETIKAAANKVNTVTSGPNPAELGGIVTMAVSGSTGTVGTGPPGHPDGSGSFKANPATSADWPADAYQLIDASIDFASSGTFDDTLIVTGLGANEDYTATFTFRAVGATTGPTSVSPVNFIASGTQIKHTDTSGFASLPPIQPPVNNLLLTKSASPTNLGESGGTVTYTVTVQNSGTVDGRLDDFVDDLPTGVTYVASSARYDGTLIDDPVISGQTLTFIDTFDVAAGSSASLTYDAAVPGVVGNYINSVVGHVTSTEIDASLALSDSSAAAVTVVVGDPDDPPVANDDSAETDAGDPVDIDVTSNDTDPDGDLDIGSVAVSVAPSDGTATVNGDGTITYSPDTGFSGDDTFTYEVCDGAALCDTAEVTVTVSASPTSDPETSDPVNAAPTAVDDSATTTKGKPVTIDVLANDTDDGDLDPSDVSVSSSPEHGTATVGSDGRIVYTPEGDFTGTDTFTYKVCDGEQRCDTATVTVTVAQANDAPTYTGKTSLAVPVGGKVPDLTFTDQNGHPYTVTLVDGSLPPGLTLDADGTWSGTAPASGTYTFTVRACDNQTPPACTDSEITVTFGALARSGSSTWMLMLTGLALVIAGALALRWQSPARTNNRA